MKTLVCGIGKLENHYLREWVEWYKDIGTTNIVLYDNNDVNGERFEEVIGDYIENGFVILKDCRGRSKMQIPAYQSCYDEYNKDYDWIGFFDIDEFLEFDKGKKFSDFVSEPIFNDCGFIKVCWKNFDDNDIIRVENNNYSIQRFTRTIAETNTSAILANKSTKIIVKGGLKNFKFYPFPGGEHGWFLPFTAVDCHGNICATNTQVINEKIWDNAWLNHYRFKTLEEYCTQKMVRAYPNINLKEGKKILTLDAFFEYNKKTVDKEKFYYETMADKDNILCVILNYKHDNNALRWYDTLKNTYQTYLIDTYYVENNSNSPFDVSDDHILLCDNLYFGGSTVKAMELFQKNACEFLLTITSDVECDDENMISFLRCITDISKRDDIGVWEPSAKIGSYCNGSTNMIITNMHQYCHNTNNLREVYGGEGWIELVRKEIVDAVYPFLSYEDNKFGWGINDAYNRVARREGYKVVIDDRVSVFHPNGTGYNANEANIEWEAFRSKYTQIGIDSNDDLKKPDEIKTLVCCIGKNENRYIREYVDHYKNIGIAHICLYDNNDIDGEHFEDVIQKDIDEGFVNIVDYRGRKLCQLQAYEECYNEHGDEYDWIFFIDCGDEYFDTRMGTVGNYLAMPQFRNYDLIHVNLKTFGDSDTTEVSDKPLKERFTEPIPFDQPIAYDFPENCHVSSIVRGGLGKGNVLWRGTPHTPYPCSLRCCNNVGFTTMATSPFAPVDYQMAEFRHYTTKTAKEYCDKMKRGFPDHICDNERIRNLVETRFFKTNKVTKEKVEIFKQELGVDMSHLLPIEEDEVEKGKKVQIYSLCYSKKDFKFLNDKVITPLQVGAANGTEVCRTKDNTGDNISQFNYFFVENTGTFWIWRNIHDAEYKGQMQYRRPLKGIDENTDFDEIFKNYDVITCEPFHHPDHKEPTKEDPMCIPADTVEQGYAFSNCIDDLYILEMVVKRQYPEYAEDWDRYIKNGTDLYYSNGFVLKSEDFDRYAEFSFDCLNRYLALADIHNEKDLVDHVKYNLEVGKYIRYQEPSKVAPQAIKWQTEIGGFLSERLWTLWVQHNFPQERIYKAPYVKMEEGMYT